MGSRGVSQVVYKAITSAESLHLVQPSSSLTPVSKLLPTTKPFDKMTFDYDNPGNVTTKKPVKLAHVVLRLKPNPVSTEYTQIILSPSPSTILR